ncbi:MAG: TlpA family protein disulfide reductase, partial [Bacteroidota bacterium]|nr:TlpA family protein disulfide reductase [Bacteroidota bacterium]
MPSQWRVILVRKDGVRVPFQLVRDVKSGWKDLAVVNGPEHIPVTGVRTRGDSLFFSLPAFESSFKLQILANGDLRGTYIKGTSAGFQDWTFYGSAREKARFFPSQGPASIQIFGNWDVTFTRPDGTTRKAVGIFTQNGNQVTGSFLTPSSDNRYLAGIVTGDSLYLSGFDGDNIHLFTARIENGRTLTGGTFYNGYTAIQTWKASREDSVVLPVIDDPTRLRSGDSTLDFSFPDLEGHPVSIRDPRFRGKVVIVQIMGSWCANCLDETRFLSEYYRKNRSRGVAIVAIAYELSTNFSRSKASLERIKKLLDVTY